ncbi:hypothetical protein BN14_06698 [Rhizoctonia solani AG-1 IB]|uniref:Fungal-type protein kinase domain-containing protein n=1 Tax=Thanatephorus cucumeris (strain AG1-IB / isolate 7/3/14) TaxID=1108050 RepID=M5C0Z8_THACB|nr:hypothetical protein BN14_06698 [Rhizoctonia solani AG-1 IB]
MMAILDAILGYWGLFNLGIMHRDVSDGNVMMVGEGQTFKRRKWKEQRNPIAGPQVKELAESEDMLRQVLKELGHRDPTGMLSDFDLHARHSSSPDSIDPAQPALTNDASAGAIRPRDEDPPSTRGHKRRKANLARSVPTEQEGKADADQGGSKKKKVIDYRTGTPAFMAVKVLRMPVGKPFHHSFIYDLESFFWLILWSAAAHLDNSATHPTLDAQEALDSMNQHNTSSMWKWKMVQLSFCSREPKTITETLEGFGNRWGLSIMFRDVILKLGAFFDRALSDETLTELESSPGQTFLSVVNIFRDTLELKTELHM